MKNALRSFSARWRAGAIGMLLAGVSMMAGASVLYEQPPIDGGGGYFANLTDGAQVADNFSVSSQVSLEGISWWGGDLVSGGAGGGVDSFLIRLFSNIAGVGTVIQEYASPSVSRSATALTAMSGDPVYQYDFALASPLTMSAGSYYLSVTNNPEGWFWLAGSGGDSGLWGRADDADPWGGFSGDAAFRLNGTMQQAPHPAPEPDTAVLALLAGLSLLTVRRFAGRPSA